MFILNRIHFGSIILALTMTAFGCGKSNSGDSSDAPAQSGSAFTGLQAEAQNAALAEIAKHFVKGADGWTTAMATGSAYKPDQFLRQLRDLPIDTIQSQDLDDADKLNGVEWKGTVAFKPLSCREAGEPGPAMDGMAGVSRTRGQWSDWFTVSAESLSLTKTRGSWEVVPSGLLVRGQLPTANDYANSGVK